MADTIFMIYRPQSIRFTNCELSFLSNYFKPLHSVTMREFTSDLRLLFRNIVDASREVQAMRYEATHILNNETRRFRCVETLTNRKDALDTPENLCEIYLHPTDIAERNAILEFHNQNESPTGCDEFVAMLQSYVSDNEKADKKFTGGVNAVPVLQCIIEFLHHWRGRTSLFRFDQRVDENGKTVVTAVVSVRSAAAYCLFIDVVLE